MIAALAPENGLSEESAWAIIEESSLYEYTGAGCTTTDANRMSNTNSAFKDTCNAIGTN